MNNVFPLVAVVVLMFKVVIIFSFKLFSIPNRPQKKKFVTVLCKTKYYFRKTLTIIRDTYFIKTGGLSIIKYFCIGIGKSVFNVIDVKGDYHQFKNNASWFNKFIKLSDPSGYCVREPQVIIMVVWLVCGL